MPSSSSLRRLSITALLVIPTAVLVWACSPERQFAGPASQGPSRAGAGGEGTKPEGNDAAPGGWAGMRSAGPRAPSTGMGASAGDRGDSEGGSTECPAEDRRCAGQHGLAACVDGTWLDVFKCSGDEPYCNDLTISCQPCSPASRACLTELRPKTCSAEGVWEAAAECPGDTGFCDPDSGRCLTCKPGTFQCQGNTPAICSESGSEWLTQPACSGEQPTCLESIRDCGTCSDGETQCGPDGSVLTCGPLGDWATEAACPPETPVCVDGGCVQCDSDVGAFDCNGNTPRTCKDYVWQDLVPCTAPGEACDPPTGTCVCADGYKLCGEDCIPESNCCSSGDCDANQVCSSGDCSCASGFKLCNGSCVSKSACCPSCGSNEVCNNNACECAQGFRSCEGQCLVCCDPTSSGTQLVSGGGGNATFCISTAKTLKITIDCTNAGALVLVFAANVAEPLVSATSSLDVLLDPGDYDLSAQTVGSGPGGVCSLDVRL